MVGFVFAPLLWPNQPPTQWVKVALFAGVKQPDREPDHSPPSGGEVKNTWSYISTPPYVFMVRCLIKKWMCLHGVVLI